jgi:hypothetical protein
MKTKLVSELTKEELEVITNVEMGILTKKYLDSQKHYIMTKLIENWKIDEEVAQNVVGL